jgi:hypothetical protein
MLFWGILPEFIWGRSKLRPELIDAGRSMRPGLPAGRSMRPGLGLAIAGRSTRPGGG